MVGMACMVSISFGLQVEFDGAKLRADDIQTMVFFTYSMAFCLQFPFLPKKTYLYFLLTPRACSA
jgi:hypothetical protein